MNRAVRQACMVGIAALVAGACGRAGADRVLSVDAVGAVEGTVLLDLDGSGGQTVGDTPMAGVRVGLVLEGAVDTAFSAVSNAQGAFAISAVPVGSYTFVIDTTTIGDSVEVVRIDAEQVTLGPDALASVAVIVSFPIVSVAAARAQPLGRKIFVEGIATTSIGTTPPLGIFGDSTLHVAGAAAAIRALRVQPATVQPGDSLRLLGSVGRRNGQPVLEGVRVSVLSITTTAPFPEVVNSTTAAAADAGRLDAALASVLAATITDTATVGADFVLQVDDGSGVLDVVLDGNLALDPSPYTPTTLMDVTGVLVPTGAGVWRLKARGGQDLVVR